MKTVKPYQVPMPVMYNASGLLGFLFKARFEQTGHLRVTMRTSINLCLHVRGSWLPVALFNFMKRINLWGGGTTATPGIFWQTLTSKCRAPYAPELDFTLI